ncbi:MAG: CD225/dispanin family protein [Prevotella sp.]|nr:CD225/dispanin family protein [Prevotella sp.]
MVLAILTTIFCCLPTGIYAIIQASKVDKLYMSGEYNEAMKASDDAKKWSIIGIVISVVCWIFYLIFVFAFGGLAFLGAMSEA